MVRAIGIGRLQQYNQILRGLLDQLFLLNSHLNYQFGKWSFSLWGRNLNDRDVIVRGFGAFGNDPRKNYVVEPYYQYGEPRVIGATAKYSL